MIKGEYIIAFLELKKVIDKVIEHNFQWVRGPPRHDKSWETSLKLHD